MKKSGCVCERERGGGRERGRERGKEGGRERERESVSIYKTPCTMLFCGCIFNMKLSVLKILDGGIFNNNSFEALHAAIGHRKECV